MYVHVYPFTHTCTTPTCTCLCVHRRSPGDTQKMVALVPYKKGTWGLGNRGERETF